MTLSKPLLVVKGPHSYAGFQHVPPLFCGHLLMDIRNIRFSAQSALQIRSPSEVSLSVPLSGGECKP